MPPTTLATRLSAAVGEKTASQLGKAFGMQTVADALGHYPRRYARRGELTPISSLLVGEAVTIVAEVRSAHERRMKQRKGSILEVVISDGRGELSLTFFNQAWRAAALVPGRRGIFAGKVGAYKQALQLAHPDYELFDDVDTALATAAASANTPIPLYPATATVASWQFSKIVATLLKDLEGVVDPLPDELRSRHGLLGAREALTAIHRPRDPADVTAAQEALRWQEAFVLQAALLQQRAETRSMSAAPRHPGPLLADFDASLPFPLTPDQVEVGERIARGLAEP